MLESAVAVFMVTWITIKRKMALTGWFALGNRVQKDVVHTTSMKILGFTLTPFSLSWNYHIPKIHYAYSIILKGRHLESSQNLVNMKHEKVLDYSGHKLLEFWSHSSPFNHLTTEYWYWNIGLNIVNHILLQWSVSVPKLC